MTTARSKPLIIDRLNAAIRDDDITISDADTIQELKTYVVEDNGSTNALAGCHDDRVMALAIAWEMLRHLPKRHSFENRKCKPAGKAGY